MHPQFMRTLAGKVLMALVIYALGVALVYYVTYYDIESMAICCGLYGDYTINYLPFPVTRTSAWSDWGGGPTQFYPLGLVLDVLFPIALVWLVILRHRAKSCDLESANSSVDS